MVTHNYTTTIKSSLGLIVSAPSAIAGDVNESIANVVPTGETVVETLDIDVTQLQAFYIWSDRDLTVTPSGSDPIALKANKPYCWNNEQVGDCPITVAITDITFDNSDGLVDANVKAEFLLTVAS